MKTRAAYMAENATLRVLLNNARQESIRRYAKDEIITTCFGVPLSKVLDLIIADEEKDAERNIHRG